MVGLTRSEYEILVVVWAQEKPLTCVGILDQIDNDALKIASIYQTINGMLHKKLLEVSGVELCGSRYRRVFKALITPEDYALMQVDEHVSNAKNKCSCLHNILVGLINKSDINEEVIGEIEALLQKKREEL